MAICQDWNTLARLLNVETGDTVVHFAAQNGLPEAVISLIDRGGAQTDLRNNQGKTPLYEAASRGDEVTMRALLQRGADLNARYLRITALL